MSLIAWNSAFGPFGGLLLCIHQDLALHMDDNSGGDIACLNGLSCAGDADAVPVAGFCMGTDESCVDIELVAELLPIVRLHSAVSCLPLRVLLDTGGGRPRIPEPSHALVPKGRPAQSLPHPPWLTAAYLHTIVIRV